MSWRWGGLSSAAQGDYSCSCRHTARCRSLKRGIGCVRPLSLGCVQSATFEHWHHQSSLRTAPNLRILFELGGSLVPIHQSRPPSYMYVSSPIFFPTPAITSSNPRHDPCTDRYPPSPHSRTSPYSPFTLDPPQPRNPTTRPKRVPHLRSRAHFTGHNSG